MPKYDFNTPLLKANGDQELVARVDAKKLKPHPQNPSVMVPTQQFNEEGFAILDPVMVGGPLSRILNTVGEGDDKLPFDQRALRGKLARKVADTGKGSLKNYTVDELKVIQEQVAKHGSTELLTQVDEIINGVKEKESEAA